MVVYTLNRAGTLWEAYGRDPVPYGPIYVPPEWPLTPGTYIPGATTTGPRPSVELTTVNGDLIVGPESDRVYENIDILGRIIFGTSAGPRAVFRNFAVHGNVAAAKAATTSYNLIQGTSSSLLGMNGATFEDGRIDGTGRETWWLQGVIGGNFTMRRCEIKRVVDGINFTTPVVGSLVETSWIHAGLHYTWTAPETGDGHSDGQTHGDAIACGRGKDITVRWNKLGGRRNMADLSNSDDFNNTGMMIGQAVSAAEANLMERHDIYENWIEGATSGVNEAVGYGYTLPTVSVHDNFFLPREASWGGRKFIKQLAITGPTLDNVNYPEMTPLVISNGG